MSLPFFRQEINFDWFETQLSQIFFNHTWVLQDITLWITIRRIMKFSQLLTHRIFVLPKREHLLLLRLEPFSECSCYHLFL